MRCNFILKIYEKTLTLLLGIFLLSSCNFGETHTIQTPLEPKLETKNFMAQYFEQIGVTQFKELLETEEYTLLDVRTPDELPVYGKISEDQLLIDINSPDFASRILQLDKTKKYLVYCWHGNRSQVARIFMQEQGFSFAKDLAGGIDEWENSGEEVIR